MHNAAQLAALYGSRLVALPVFLSLEYTGSIIYSSALPFKKDGPSAAWHLGCETVPRDSLLSITIEHRSLFFLPIPLLREILPAFCQESFPFYCGLPGKRSIAISVLGTLSG